MYTDSYCNSYYKRLGKKMAENSTPNNPTVGIKKKQRKVKVKRAVKAKRETSQERLRVKDVPVMHQVIFPYNGKHFFYCAVHIYNPNLAPPMYIPIGEKETMGELKQRLASLFKNVDTDSMCLTKKLDDTSTDKELEELEKWKQKGYKINIMRCGDTMDDVEEMTVEEYKHKLESEKDASQSLDDMNADEGGEEKEEDKNETVKESTTPPPSGYWIGPYGVLVPNHVESVPAEDGGNTFYKDGSETLMCAMQAGSTKEEWLSNCATCINGQWYYKEKKKKEDTD
jgi:hypothetical protein